MMRKFFMICVFCLMAAAQSFAADYGYLIIQKNDGSQVSFNATGLKITFQGTNLIANDNGNETTLSLAELSKMFFSNTATGVKLTEAETEKQAGPITVFTVAGKKVAVVNDALEVQKMKPGMYIIKQGNNASKVLVK